MNRNNWVLKISVFLLIFGGALINPRPSKAFCWVGTNGGPSSCSGTGCQESCTTNSSGGADGTTYYSCGTYCFLRDADNNCVAWGDGCYWNVWHCTKPCGSEDVPGCFVPGTIVGNSSGGKAIEEVKVGDTIDSFDKDGKVTEAVVSNIYKVRRDYYYKLIAGEYSVEVTAEHPFYIGNDKYEETQNLRVGDTLYVEESGKLVVKKIDSLTRINEPTDAYNMTVDDTHTYFADDLRV